MSEQIPERVVERIKSRISVNENGCWIWPGAQTMEGYGRIGWTGEAGKTWRLTHRAVYEALVGPIPEGHDMDHVCHDPRECQPERFADCPHHGCCNPAHLRPVTRRENLLRGGTISAERRATEQCPQGHPYDGENTLVSPQGQRQCKECTYERNRAYYWKNRERRKEYNRAWRQRNIQTKGNAE
jgi:hypothetical protein